MLPLSGPADLGHDTSDRSSIMTNSSDKPDDELTIARLKRLAWTKGLSEAAIEDLAAVGEYVQLEDGDVVHRADEELTAVFFVVTGRLRATVIDMFGNELFERSLIRG